MASWAKRAFLITTIGCLKQSTDTKDEVSEMKGEITKQQLAEAKFKAEVNGGWVNKELYRRLKASAKTQKILNRKR